MQSGREELQLKGTLILHYYLLFSICSPTNSPPAFYVQYTVTSCPTILISVIPLDAMDMLACEIKAASVSQRSHQLLFPLIIQFAITWLAL